MQRTDATRRVVIVRQPRHVCFQGFEFRAQTATDTSGTPHVSTVTKRRYVCETAAPATGQSREEIGNTSVVNVTALRANRIWR
jgi:hypothetical protein